MFWAIAIKNKAGSKVVGLYLTLKTLREDLPRNLYARSSISIYKDKQFTQIGIGIEHFNCKEYEQHSNHEKL